MKVWQFLIVVICCVSYTHAMLLNKQKKKQPQQEKVTYWLPSQEEIDQASECKENAGEGDWVVVKNEKDVSTAYFSAAKFVNTYLQRDEVCHDYFCIGNIITNELLVVGKLGKK